MASGTVGTLAVDHLPAQPAAPAGGRAMTVRVMSASVRAASTTSATRSPAAGAGAGASQVPRSAEAYVPPAQSTVFRTDWSRRRPAMAAREVAQKAGLEPLFRSQVRTQVEGLDVLDRIDGPVIFVANHASHLDTPLILLLAARRVAAAYRAWRRRPTTSSTPGGARSARRCCSTPSRSTAAAARWRRRPARCSPTAGAW